MVLRNVAKSFSLEQQRLEINSLASDVHALSQGAVASTTYTMNPVDGTGPDRKIIRHAGSDGITADVVLVAGTGLSIGLSGGEITFTNNAVETDPVYSASAAANVTNTKITNWDTAYGWGDHSTQGYAITSDLNTAVANSSNWDTAYGWGDHSTSGYLTSVAFALNDITDVDTTGVTTGQALIWNAPSSTWIAGTVASSGGGIALTDITVTSLSPGTASLIYDNTSGVFSYTPPDLSGYSTFSGSYNDLTDKPTFSVSDLTDVNSTSPSTGQILKWDGTEWSPAADLTSTGTGIALSDMSVNVLSVGTSTLTYNNTTGVFSYTPPDLSAYSTFSGSYNDLTNQPTLFSGSYTDLTNQPTIPAAYTNSDVDSHLNVTSSPTNGHVLSWNGSDYAWVAQSSGGSSGGSGTTYQWANGVVASGWSASDLSSEMFDGSLTSWSKAETTSADYLGWDNTANGANLPILNGPVEIFIRYADTANYTYEVNGASVTPDVSGAVGATGGWVTLTSGTAGSFKVSTTNTSLNISISGVKSNGLLLTPTALYNNTSGGIALTDISVSVNSPGTAGLSYNNGTGVFTYTPPDLTSGSDTLDTVLSRGATTTRDINTTGKVYFANVFSTTGDLPSASSYHGMFAHVHGTGKGYFAHAGAWVPLANESQIANATEWDTAYGWGDHAQAGYSTNNYSQQLIGGSTAVQLNFLTTAVSGGAPGTTSIVMNAGNNITFSNVSSAGFTIDSAGGSSSGGSGTVTQIDTGTGISGGPITSSGTIELADTGVTAGTYNNPDQIVVNGQGQITSLTQGTGAVIPTGIIVMWSGSASSVPSGWALCNGQTVSSSTTPDLRGMFIVGSGGTYSTGDTGGSESVVLTTSDLPSHTHTISAHTHNIGNHGHSVDSHSHNIGNHSHTVGDHSHNISGSSVGNTGITTVPHTHPIVGTVGTGSGLAAGVNYTGDYSPRSTDAATDTSHSHPISLSISGSTSMGGPGLTGDSSGSTGTSSPGTNQASGVIDDGGSGDTGSTGNGTAHENRPPYYALAYIMKV